MPFPVPANEVERVAALHALEVLDSGPEPAFLDVVILARTICRAPMAAVNFVDGDRQWSKASAGSWSPDVSREHSFCARAILGGGPLVVPDTHADPAWATNPLVIGPPHLRAYAGATIVTAAGVALGAVCVADRVPRAFGRDELEGLERLARQVAGMLELRQASDRLVIADARLSRLATEDELTGLATRRVLVDRLEHGLREHRRTDAGLGVLFADLDALRAVNEQHGHHAGDRLLQVVAARLRDASRASDTVARLGGDEFAVLCPGARSIAALDVAAARLRCAVGLPVDIAGAMLTPRLSIGVALAGPGDDIAGLLRRADADMDEEKRGALALR